MSYYQAAYIIRFIDEEGRSITKTKYFYGKTKEEAEYKCRKHLKASSDVRLTGKYMSACKQFALQIISQPLHYSNVCFKAKNYLKYNGIYIYLYFLV